MEHIVVAPEHERVAEVGVAVFIAARDKNGAVLVHDLKSVDVASITASLIPEVEAGLGEWAV